MSEAAGAPRKTLSAAVICLDEARNIGACLESLAWCDEIVVVDSGSRDATVEIARKHATRVLHHAWPGYVAQKNWALEQTTGEWVLCVDADERCTPALRAAIENALRLAAGESPRDEPSNGARFPRSEPTASGEITKPLPRSEPTASGEITKPLPRSEPTASGEITKPLPRSEPTASGEITEAGFEVRRHVFYMGRWIDHGGWYPDWKLRLVRRGKARWGGVDPHDKLIADGPVRRLDAELVHFTYADFAAHLRTVQRFSDVVSDGWIGAGRRFSLWRAIAHPPAKFFACYVWKRGFLDGWPGFVIAMTSSFYVFAKYVKLREKQLPRSEPTASGEFTKPLPRSEPAASGEITKPLPRSEPAASGETPKT